MVPCFWHTQHPLTLAQGSVKKRHWRTLVPPGGKSMTTFVDDISMPAITVNECVCQLLEQARRHLLEKLIANVKVITDCR